MIVSQHRGAANDLPVPDSAACTTNFPEALNHPILSGKE